MGLIDRHIIPGERHDHFQISEDALKRTVQHGLEEEIKLFRSLAQHGLELMKNEDSVRRRWPRCLADGATSGLLYRLTCWPVRLCEYVSSFASDP